MNIVVDTNIIFSALLNPDGTVGEILLNNDEKLHFFAPSFILEELSNHQEKLIKLSGLSEDELAFMKRILFQHIDLIDVDVIPQRFRQQAFDLVNDVDEADAPFVALALALEVPLWTGDKKLISGLEKKKEHLCWNTERVQENFRRY